MPSTSAGSAHPAHSGTRDTSADHLRAERPNVPRESVFHLGR